jgi:hypothetical protein
MARNVIIEYNSVLQKFQIELHRIFKRIMIEFYDESFKSFIPICFQKTVL